MSLANRRRFLTLWKYSRRSKPSGSIDTPIYANVNSDSRLPASLPIDSHFTSFTTNNKPVCVGRTIEQNPMATLLLTLLPTLLLTLLPTLLPTFLLTLLPTLHNGR